MWWFMVLVACDAGVSIDEAPVAFAEVAPDGSDEEMHPVVPEDGRPEVSEEERLAAARAAARAAQPPTVVVPQGERAREWSWDFEHKGGTQTQRLRADPTLEEGHAIEQAQAIENGDWDARDLR